MTKFEKISTITSVVAIIASGIVFYYQFFRSDHTMYASIIDPTCSSDSTIDISSQIVYSNKGNEYCTILQNFFILYKTGKEEVEKYNQRIFLRDDYQNTTKYDPLVLKPGEQCIKTIILHDKFLKNCMGDFTYYIGYKINVAIEIYFLNSDNLKTSELIDIGWITLDENLRISTYNFDYITVNLKGNGYYGSVYSK